MDYPDDLPWMLEYRVSSTVRPTLPRRAVTSISSSGDTDARVVCPQVPHGATGWRLPGQADWRPLAELPPHWMPFLDRERPGPLDPRPAVEVRRPPIVFP